MLDQDRSLVLISFLFSRLLAILPRDSENSQEPAIVCLNLIRLPVEASRLNFLLKLLILLFLLLCRSKRWAAEQGKGDNELE